LANNYLYRWPNLDEGFYDFSRKIELFTCAGESQRAFSYKDLPIGISEPVTLKSFFSGYAEAMDAYLRWHFMPSGYEKIEASLVKERFYNQKAQLTKGKGWQQYSFVADSGQVYVKELEYICRRLNERCIHAEDEERMYFESGFK